MSDTMDDTEMYAGFFGDSHWADDDGPLYDGAYEAEGRLYDERPVGLGECPECGAPTRLITNGPHGWFYGCTKWPKCRGSRMFDPDEVEKGVFYADRIKLPYCRMRKPEKARRRSFVAKVAGLFKAGRRGGEAGKGKG